MSCEDITQELVEEFGDRLDKLGLTIEIVPDENAEPYFSLGDSRVVAVEAPKASPAREGIWGGTRETSFDWDLEKPFKPDGDGFSSRSLFLYLHSMREIERFMKNGFTDYGKPVFEPKIGTDFDLALDCLRNAIKETDSTAKADHIQGFLHYAEGGEAQEWLEAMIDDCGGTYGDSAKGTPFAFDDSGNFHAASAINAVNSALKDWDGRSQMPSNGNTLLGWALNEMEIWEDFFERTYGGVLLRVKEIKADFAKTFGAGEAAAWECVGIDDYGRAVPDAPECASVAYVLHWKDVAGMGFDSGVAREYFKAELDAQLKSLNGNAMEFEITDSEGNTVESVGGFTNFGDMEACVERALDEISDRMAAKPRG